MTSYEEAEKAALLAGWTSSGGAGIFIEGYLAGMNHVHDPESLATEDEFLESLPEASQ